MQTRASFAASKSKNTIANNNNNNNIDNDIGDEIYPVTTDNNTPRRAGSSRNQIRRESIKDSDYEVEDKFDDDDDDEDSPSSTVHVKNGRESEKSKCNKIAACEACRRVHRKCDGKLPKCSCCAQRGLKCVYLEPKKRGPVRGLSKQLKEQVQKLEQEITKLRQQNLTLMAQAPPSDESSTSSPSSPSPPSSIPSPSTSPSPSIMQNHGSTNTTTTTNNSALQHEAPFYNKIANLIEVYFSYINRVFPLVLRRTLDPALNVVLQQRGKHTMSPTAEALYPQIFLLYVILAISAQRTGDNVAEQFFLSKARTDVGKLYDCCSYDSACGFVLLLFYHLSEGHDAQAMLNLKLASEICKSMGAANMRGGGGRGSNLHKCVLLAKVLCEKNLSKKRKHLQMLLTQYFENTKFRYYSEDESEYEQPLMSCKSTSTTTNNNNNNNNNAAASPSFSSLFNTKPPQVTLGLEKVIAIMSQVVSELETHEPHTIDYMAYSNILQALENYSNFVFDNDEMLLLQSTIQIWSARAMVLKNANLKSLSLEWCNKTTMLTRNSKFSMVCPTVVSPLRHVVDIHIDENCSQMLEEDFISWKQLYKRFKSAAPTMEKLRDYFNQNAKSFSKFLEQQETEDREEESRYRATYGQAATATATAAAAAAAAQPPPPLPPPAIMNQQQQQQVPPPMQRQYSPQPIASPSSSSSSNSSNSHSNSNSNFFGHSFPPPAPPPQQQHLYHHHYTSNYQHGGYHHQHYHHHHHQHQHRYQQQPQPFRQPMAPSAAVQTQNSFFYQPHQHRGSSAIQQPYHHHHHEYQHQNGAGNNDNNNNIINNNNNNDNNNNGSVLEDLFGVDANQITQLEFDLMHSVE